MPRLAGYPLAKTKNKNWGADSRGVVVLFEFEWTLYAKIDCLVAGAWFAGGFFCGAVEQIGLPIPAYPILIIAGAMIVQGKFSWAACVLVALPACMLGDQFWYQAGRWRGKQVSPLGGANPQPKGRMLAMGT